MPTSTSKTSFLRGDAQLPGVGRYASQSADCMKERVLQAWQGVLASTSFFFFRLQVLLGAPKAYPRRSAASFSGCEVDGGFRTFLRLLGHHLAARYANLHLASVCATADSAWRRPVPLLRFTRPRSVLAATGSRVHLCSNVIDVGRREVNLRLSFRLLLVIACRDYSLSLPSMWACGPCLTSRVTGFTEGPVLPAMRLLWRVGVPLAPRRCLREVRSQDPPELVVAVVPRMRLWLLAFFEYRLLLLRQRPWPHSVREGMAMA